jgi:hypothetical protein
MTRQGTPAAGLGDNHPAVRRGRRALGKGRGANHRRVVKEKSAKELPAAEALKFARDRLKELQ